MDRMPGTKVWMRKVREVLRLKHALGMSERLIADAVGVGKTAVGEYLRRCRVIGLGWPLPDGMDEAELERRLFTPAGFHDGPPRQLPECPNVHEELKRRGVTLMLLWEEYRAEHTEGYGYSRFCDLWGEWRKRITPTMRQMHVAGEKLFVDWAGDTIPVFDPATGEEHRAHTSPFARFQAGPTFDDAATITGVNPVPSEATLIFRQHQPILCGSSERASDWPSFN